MSSNIKILKIPNKEEVFPFSNIAEENQLKCPLCDFNYNHFIGKPELKDGKDTSGAGWSGRGDLVTIKLWGECGHNWSLNFGFHKGNIFCFWDEVKCVACKIHCEDGDVV